MKNLWMVLCAMVLAGCSFGPSVKLTPATYDLGAPQINAGTARNINASLLLHNVDAPFWLDTTEIAYRLGQDAGRQRSYADSRWAASPAALLTQRLRDRLTQASTGGVVGVADGVRVNYALRVELEDFSQVFDRADTSRGVVAARASLVDAAQRTLIAQKDFVFEKAAPTPDAAGGVRALTAASDELVNAVVAWTAANIAVENRREK
ncbi:MAG TPA: ABC-type transport auxiliary lipoprotein family protein [Burkholderiales bacterium]|nr:ABC-type transport auxiliary lipoprotein family protein [Burkholderiales bacterium]